MCYRYRFLQGVFLFPAGEFVFAHDTVASQGSRILVRHKIAHLLQWLRILLISVSPRMATFNWRFRPYAVPETVFHRPEIPPGATSLEIARLKAAKPWSRSPVGLPSVGYEPTAFVFQSSFPTALQYLLVLGLFSQAAPFIVRHFPVNMFPRFIPTTIFTNKNWFLFAHKGT